MPRYQVAPSDVEAAAKEDTVGTGPVPTLLERRGAGIPSYLTCEQQTAAGGGGASPPHPTARRPRAQAPRRKYESPPPAHVQSNSGPEVFDARSSERRFVLLKTEWPSHIAMHRGQERTIDSGVLRRQRQPWRPRLTPVYF